MSSEPWADRGSNPSLGVNAAAFLKGTSSPVDGGPIEGRGAGAGVFTVRAAGRIGAWRAMRGTRAAGVAFAAGGGTGSAVAAGRGKAAAGRAGGGDAARGAAGRSAARGIVSGGCATRGARRPGAAARTGAEPGGALTGAAT